ncbi:hypothetical protein AA313_de0208476 [Arthrobotrys entomopaga]|nr:hypothetical protein AA313_de0208476 [Arthrobotrys entomopaga]
MAFNFRKLEIATSLLSILVSPIAAQIATYTLDDPLIYTTTYQLRGSITNFNPPSSCIYGTVYLNEGVGTTSGTTDGLAQAVVSHLAGCHISADPSCCPPNWVTTGNNYYTGSGGDCPAGYTKLPSVSIYSGITSTYGYALRSGTKAAWPCCPFIPYSFSKGLTSGVNTPADCFPLTLTVTEGVTEVAPLCDFADVVSQVYSESATQSVVYNFYWANPIYIFDEASEESTIATTGTSTGSPTARPGSSASSMVASTQTPNNSSNPDGGDKSNSSGLSTGAAAGIGVGVGVPVVLAAIFFTYWITRRRLQSNSGVASANQFDLKHNAGVEPGVADYPGGIGGIEAGRTR